MAEPMWVADDGSYGMGNFAVVDTESWTESDWEEFEEAADWQKLDIAIEKGKVIE